MTVLVGQLKEADAELVAYHLADGVPDEERIVHEELVVHHRVDAVGGEGVLHTIGAATGRRAGPAVAERDGTPSERRSGAGGGEDTKEGQAHIGGVWVARHLATLAGAMGAVAVAAAPAPWTVVLGVVVIAVAFVGVPLAALLHGRREHDAKRRAGLDLMAGGAAAVIVTVVAAWAAGQRK